MREIVYEMLKNVIDTVRQEANKKMDEAIDEISDVCKLSTKLETIETAMNKYHDRVDGLNEIYSWLDGAARVIDEGAYADHFLPRLNQAVKLLDNLE